MSEYDYKQGQRDAERFTNPSPPDPNKTWYENNSNQNGFKERQEQLQNPPKYTP
jgi:hypothetical protein